LKKGAWSKASRSGGGGGGKKKLKPFRKEESPEKKGYVSLGKEVEK